MEVQRKSFLAHNSQSFQLHLTRNLDDSELIHIQKKKKSKRDEKKKHNTGTTGLDILRGKI